MTATEKTNKTFKNSLRELYVSTIQGKLQEELAIANIHQVPRIEKIVVSIGIGKNKEDKKFFEIAEKNLTSITGQKPMASYAKKSIAGFKLREGSKLGYYVTLRGDIMYEFLDRLINITLPRVRDFHGVNSRSFDLQGNYNLGFNEQSIFPEIDFEDMSTLHGIQVTIVIKSMNKEHSLKLLQEFGMPFNLPKEKKEANNG